MIFFYKRITLLSIVFIAHLGYCQQSENFDGAGITLPTNSYYKNTTTNNWQTSAPLPFGPLGLSLKTTATADVNTSDEPDRVSRGW